MKGEIIRKGMIRTKVMLIMCLMVAGVAQAQLKIDFGTATSAVEDGYQAWTAAHEDAGTFVPQTFNAFGTKVTVSVTWPNNPVYTAKQMYDRTASPGDLARYSYETDHEALIQDWIGSDGRVTNESPLRVTLSGVPKGTYSWLSYHHDVIDQTGLFDVTITDDYGVQEFNDVNITNSYSNSTHALNDVVSDFNDFGIFTATLVSNGTDDIILDFWLEHDHDFWDEISTEFFLMNGFVMEPVSSREAAKKPSPGDGFTNIYRDTILSWTAGEGALSHDVYLGTFLADVEAASRDSDPSGVLVSRGQSGTTYTPPTLLEYGQKYYWRVDEEQADGSFWKENLWNFTVETYTYAIEDVNVSTSSHANSTLEGPEKMVDGSGITGDMHSTLYLDMWLTTDTHPTVQYEFDDDYCLYEMLVWNYNSENESNFGLNNVTLKYSLDGQDWTALGTFDLAQAPGAATGPTATIDFGRAVARYVRMTVNSNHGGAKSGLAEVRFMQLPVKARIPQPADGASGVTNDVVLSWRPGREAASHEVYLSSDRDAVVNGTAPKQSVTGLSFPTSGLTFNTTYYWKVNEVNPAVTPSTREGDVWSFTVQEYVVVDDFESYNSKRDEGTTIFQTWSEDGYAESPKFSTNSGQMGYTNSPWVEVDIAYGGKQSGPFYYGKGTPTISEASRPIDNADWTQFGIKALSLRFFGDPGNTATQLYVKINSGDPIYYNGYANDVKIKSWNYWYVDLTNVPGVTNVTKLTVGASGGKGMVLLDDILLSAYDLYMVTPTVPDTAGQVLHYEFEGNLTDSAGSYDAEMPMEEGAIDPPTASYTQGQQGRALLLDGVREFITVADTFDNLDTYTVALWFSVRGGLNDRALFSAYETKTDPNGAHGILLEVKNDGSFRYVHQAPIGENQYGLRDNGTYDDGDWYHAAVVKSNDTITLFINGLAVASQANENALGGALTEICIGILAPTRDEDERRYFPGAIDEVYLYSRALAQGEIAWLAGRTTPFAQP